MEDEDALHALANDLIAFPMARVFSIRWESYDSPVAEREHIFECAATGLALMLLLAPGTFAAGIRTSRHIAILGLALWLVEIHRELMSAAARRIMAVKL